LRSSRRSVRLVSAADSAAHAERTLYVNYHKSTGMLIGLLILARLAWRLKHKPPPLPASMPIWERRAARANHVLLYACMIIMPLARLYRVELQQVRVNFFNAVQLPPWGVDDRSLYAFFTACTSRRPMSRGADRAPSARGDEARHLPATWNIAAHAPVMRILGIALLFPCLGARGAVRLCLERGLGKHQRHRHRDRHRGRHAANGGKPRGAAAAGDWLYVSDQPNNRLILVNLKERKTLARSRRRLAEGVGRSADGRWIAAASEQSNSVTFIDTQLQREAFTVKVRGQNPEHAIFRPDAGSCTSSAEDGDTVEVIDLDQRAQITQIRSARGHGASASFPTAAARTLLRRMRTPSSPSMPGPTKCWRASRPASARTASPSIPMASVSTSLTAVKAQCRWSIPATNTIVATVPVGQRPWTWRLRRTAAALCGQWSIGFSVGHRYQSNTSWRDVTVEKLPWAS